MSINNSPFTDAVVPVPGGEASGGAVETGGRSMPDPGTDPVMWAFQERCCPTPGVSETANTSGLPPRIDVVGPPVGDSVPEPSMLQTPKNLV